MTVAQPIPQNPKVDIKELEESLFQRQIDSHQSQFTNIRIHKLEEEIDMRRALVRSDPSIDNVLALWGLLESLFSYMQSMIQFKPEKNEKDLFVQRVVTLGKMRKEILQYWNFYKLGLIDKSINPAVFELRQSRPQDYKLVVQFRLVKLTTEFADLLRRAFQYLSYYFRQNKWRKNMGLEGDFIRSKLDILKKEVKEARRRHDTRKVEGKN